ncbi:hypothetical protein LEWO105114_04045 [Legionella worsleiensis]|uniref:Uncharacterized protein n=1 Tax=Legionella worsleiensis TaxID=45076 RepID=A0A0W1AK24_9GAMM|nr:hypothetical protein Lwor_0396 [Legionella worsleiensis]STY31977.1 Uncharacterised protein [Legionella worsleiensis]
MEQRLNKNSHNSTKPSGQTHLNYEHKSPTFCLRPVLYAQDPCDLSAGKDLDSAHKAQNVGILVLDNTFRCVYPDKTILK